MFSFIVGLIIGAIFSPIIIRLGKILWAYIDKKVTKVENK